MSSPLKTRIDGRIRVQGAWAWSIWSLCIAACAPVGPNYVGPPQVAGQSIQSPEFLRAVVAPMTPSPPPARWWEGVADPMLTQLIDDAFAASPTLMAAEARLRSARAQLSGSRVALGPTGGGTAGYLRGRIPGSVASGLGVGGGGGGSGGGGGVATSNSSSIDLESFNVSLDASWELDLFGGKRRGIEGAAAAADAQQASLEDAQVTLANDMAQAYAQLREAQNRLALAQRTISLRQQSLALNLERRQRGTIAQGGVERYEGELAQALAELPGLQTQADRQLDQIALLAGRETGAYDDLLANPKAGVVDVPSPPETVPVGSPADWLRRRPDIRQAERTLASRNATIGKNVAALFPSVSVFGLVTAQGMHPGNLFKGPPLWLALPSLTWNFLSIPANEARVEGAKADYEESIADYQRAVLAALRDANDALSRFGHQHETLVERDKARESAERAAIIVRARYAAGTVSLIDALDSERQRAQADDQWVQAKAGYLVSYATLQKSLGIGWRTPTSAP